MLCYTVYQLIERAGRPPDDQSPAKKMTDSWEELNLVNTSPKLLQEGIEGVVMKQIAAATKKGMKHTHTHTRGELDMWACLPFNQNSKSLWNDPTLRLEDQTAVWDTV